MLIRMGKNEILYKEYRKWQKSKHWSVFMQQILKIEWKKVESISIQWDSKELIDQQWPKPFSDWIKENISKAAGTRTWTIVLYQDLPQFVLQDVIRWIHTRQITL